MIVEIHQPQYLPWIGYFDKIDRANVFVLLDNVQYKKNEWQNRNRIRTSQGWQWITVTVLYKYPEKINAVKINFISPQHSPVFWE
ncbi:MAG: WbqC family protein [Candidatus Brocadiaceae bacterium]|nr:WbqC family protein [Candidatus Brocadiaceae bacterium]